MAINNFGGNTNTPDKNGKYRVNSVPAVEQPFTIKSSVPDQHIYLEADGGEILPLSAGKGTTKTERHNNLIKSGSIFGWALLTTTTLAVIGAIASPYLQPKPLDKDQQAAYTISKMGITGFNKEAGEDIAVGYVKAYLSIKTDDTSDPQLSWYLNGDSLSNTNTTNAAGNIRTYTSNTAQQVIGTPRVVRIIPQTAEYTTYRVTALVKPSATGTTNNLKEATKTIQTSELKQITLSVGVAYSNKTGRYYIATPAPTILPSPVMGRNTDLNQPANPTGEAIQPTAETNSVIQGFIKAFTIATPEKHSDLDQYVVDTKKLTLATAGLGGTYTVNTNTINYTLTTDDGGKTLTAKVTFDLTDEVGGTTDTTNNENTKQTITYPGTYTIKLTKEGNGKYLVSEFYPWLYTTDTGKALQ